MTYSEWIRKHRQHFLQGEYDIKDMIHLSLAAGWTRSDISKTLHHWPRALWVADVEGSISRIAKEQSDHLEETLKRKDNLSLQDQWHELYYYQEHGIVWDESINGGLQ